jgi:hypothetical protein
MEVVRALRQINFGGSGAASPTTTGWAGSAVPRTAREAGMGDIRLGSRTSALGPPLVSRAMRAMSYRCHYARVGCWLIVSCGALLM